MTPTEQDKELREQVEAMTTDNTQAELRKEIDIVIGNPLDRERDTDAMMQLITAYTNKRVEAVLDRLEATKRTANLCTDDTYVVKQKFIEAERIKLQAGGDWQGIAILTAMKLKEKL